MRRLWVSARLWARRDFRAAVRAARAYPLEPAVTDLRAYLDELHRRTR